MIRRIDRLARPSLLVLLSGLGACASLQGWDPAMGFRRVPASGPQDESRTVAPAGDRDPGRLLPPADTRRFPMEPAIAQGIIGELQSLRTWEDDTLAEIARDYYLGYDEIRHANPGVDPWMPGEGTPLLLPSRYILPQVREGIVLNVASRRLFYFDVDHATVYTYPVGVGRMGWSTPTGKAQVVAKTRDPVWFVPASIRQEHAEAGDPLPARVEPGPDNPLGAFALQLDMPGYLIHGTNKPFGVGMRVSHGCVRLYPEDIASLFDQVPVGTPVTIINEPLLVAEVNGTIYLEAHRPFEEDETWNGHWDEVRSRLLADERLASAAVDWTLAEQVVEQARGIPLPVSLGSRPLEPPLQAAREVKHRKPPLAVPATEAEEEIAVAEADPES